MSFDALSPWIRRPGELQPALEGNERADVVILGGGFTGLNAALQLRKAGVDVVLLEADFCGAGASGRNAGHLTPTIGKDVPTLIKQFGTEKAAALVRLAEDGVAFVEKRMREFDIACDYEPNGNIIAGVHEKQRKPLERAAKTAQEFGIKAVFLDESDMRQRLMPPAFRFGLLEGCGGLMDPGKYVSALRREALDAGVRIRENSPALSIEDGARVTAKTARGSVVADKLLLATNAYTVPAFNLLWSRIIPVRVSLFWTRPLDAAEMDSIGWVKREGIYTAHEILENYRFTADNRILGGSKTIQYAYGSRLPHGDQKKAFALLERAFRDRFPTLSHVPIDTFWGGWISITLDYLPTTGTLGKNGNIHYSLGCNGHGIAQFSLMGAAAGDAILGKPWPQLEVLKRRVPWYPPEPFRWMVGQGLKITLEAIDRRTDASLRRAG